MNTTKRELKQALLQAVERAYDAAHAADDKRQAHKPEFLKQADEHVEAVLRPLFT